MDGTRAVIGKLRHFITIQQNTPTRGTDGAAVDAWTTFAQVWASIRSPSGRDFYSSDGHNAALTHVIRIRYLAGVNRSMRVSFDSRIFNVEYLQKELETNHWLDLFCTEYL